MPLNQKHLQNSFDGRNSSVLQVTPVPDATRRCVSAHRRVCLTALERFLVPTCSGSFWNNLGLPSGLVSNASDKASLLGNPIWESTSQGVIFPRSTSYNKRQVETKLSHCYNPIMVNDRSLINQAEITITPWSKY